MIIVMNRTILIPILLSTFLLVGCETELDRCLEANTSAVIDEAQYMQKYNKNQRMLAEIWKLELTFDEQLKKSEEQNVAFDDSLTPNELQVSQCTIEKLDNSTDLNDMYSDISDSTLETAEKEEQFAEQFDILLMEIIKSCFPSNVAKKICNAQGIY